MENLLEQRSGLFWLPNTAAVRQQLLQLAHIYNNTLYNMMTCANPLLSNPLVIATRNPGVLKSLKECYGTVKGTTDKSQNVEEPFIMLSKGIM